MEVENEMEIFITSTKYNTHQQCEEGKRTTTSGDYLANYTLSTFLVASVALWPGLSS